MGHAGRRSELDEGRVNVRERWEQRKPLARVAFFGNQGPEDDAVYEVRATGNDMLALAIDRRGYLASIVITMPHLIYLVDMTPRQAGGDPADARVFLDGGTSLDIVTSTIRNLPDFVLRGAMQGMVDTGGQRVRALISHTAIREIVPLNEPSDDIAFLSVSSECSTELWPELGHKR